MPMDGKVERIIPSLKMSSGLLLFRTGILSSLPDKGRTVWERIISWGSSITVGKVGLGEGAGDSGGGITCIGTGLTWARKKGSNKGKVMGSGHARYYFHWH
jgi:hypothetical protein